MKNEIEIETLADEGAALPVYSSEEAAGADVHAHIKERLPLEPGASILVPTGLKFSIPKGFEVQVRPRSGLALNHRITVLNTPGTIDSDYRGEIKVILINHGKKTYFIEPGMRIAQLVVAPVYQATFCQAQVLAETVRGSGGFGHTGV